MGSKSSAPAAPNYQPIASSDLAAAKLSAQQSANQLDWAKQQFAQEQKDINPLIATEVAGNKQQAAQAAQTFQQYQTEYQPLEAQFRTLASKYGSKAQQTENAAMAGADQLSAGQGAINNMKAAEASYGVDPGSARSLATTSNIRAQSSAAAASAETNARIQTQMQGANMLTTAIGIGRGYPSQSTSEYAGSANSGNAAANSSLSLGSSGANLMGTGQSWMGTQGNFLNSATNTMNTAYQNQMSTFQANQQASSGIGSMLGSVVGMAGMMMMNKGGYVPRSRRYATGGHVAPSAPEPAGDIQAQLAMLDHPASARRAVFVPAGTPTPAQVPAGVGAAARPEGVLYSRDPAVLHQYQTAPQLTDEHMARILNYPQVNHEAGPGAVAVRATTPQGVAYETAVAPHALPQAISAAQANAPGAAIETMSPEAVIADRGQRFAIGGEVANVNMSTVDPSVLDGHTYHAPMAATGTGSGTPGQTMAAMAGYGGAARGGAPAFGFGGSIHEVHQGHVAVEHAPTVHFHAYNPHQKEGSMGVGPGGSPRMRMPLRAIMGGSGGGISFKGAFAEGGGPLPVSPGDPTGRADNIAIRVSGGEFVVPHSVVTRLGTNYFDKLAIKWGDPLDREAAEARMNGAPPQAIPNSPAQEGMKQGVIPAPQPSPRALPTGAPQ